MKLRCAGSRCTTTTNTSPVFVGIAAKNFFRASRPPAEAPIPTTNPGALPERGVSAPESPAAGRFFFTGAPAAVSGFLRFTLDAMARVHRGASAALLPGDRVDAQAARAEPGYAVQHRAAPPGISTPEICMYQRLALPGPGVTKCRRVEGWPPYPAPASGTRGGGALS